VTCRVLGFTRQAFYKWRRKLVTQRDFDDAYLINAALDIHREDPGFGYRFIADELPANRRTRGLNHHIPRVNRTRGSPDLEAFATWWQSATNRDKTPLAAREEADATRRRERIVPTAWNR
jgi:hypothetical protein